MNKLRRLRVFWVGRETIWNLLTAWAVTGHYMRPEAKEVPYDAQCVNVVFDWQRDAFGFILEHDSFAPIPEGESLPWVGELVVEYRTMPPDAAIAAEAQELLDRIIVIQKQA